MFLSFRFDLHEGSSPDGPMLDVRCQMEGDRNGVTGQAKALPRFRIHESDLSHTIVFSGIYFITFYFATNSNLKITNFDDKYK